MDASDFNRLLSADHYSPANLEEVEIVCRNYPAFGLAHMLRVRIMEALNYEKEEALKLAAIHAGDRSRLHAIVRELARPEEEPIESADESGIDFSEEDNSEAEVIIEQHAPYMSAEADDDDLLELDEEEDKADFLLDEELVENTADLPSIDAKQTNESLIHSFIKEEPGPIRADKARNIKKDFSVSSIREHDGFITDTLARIYIKQGLYAKAIYAYEKLSLKYPEKSAYFAAQIEKIRNINHS